MSNRKGCSLLLIAAALMALAAAPALRGETEEQGKIVIVFKDGRQLTYRLAEIARIEFHDTAAVASTMGRARFLGRWKVGDGVGNTFEITLKPDGKARKSIGGSEGTWSVVNGEARITWSDGWRDIIRKSGGKFQKAAFRPGTSFDGTPDNVTAAEYLETH